jgi:phosphate-selective porin OprO/OprP
MTSEPPIYKDDDGGLALTMRGTYLPWYDEATDGRGLWHLGVSYSFRDTPNDTVRFRQRPECHIASYIVDTGNIPDVPDWQILGLETAVVYGPFSAQAEWFCTFVRRTVGDDLFYNGGYAYVSYFLTGEHRPYKRTAGVFDRVKPFENFFRVRAEDGNVYTGKGAWELAYRFSYVDLSEYNSGENHPGTVYDHTVGMNWYLNPYTRLMFNYVNSTLDNPLGVGNMSIFEMRAQIDF